MIRERGVWVMVCTVCGQPKSWHDEHKPRHQFTAAGGPLEEREDITPATPSPQGVPMPSGDPILRLALVSAGVITPAQLSHAEQMLRAAGAVFTSVGGPILPLEDKREPHLDEVERDS